MELTSAHVRRFKRKIRWIFIAATVMVAAIYYLEASGPALINAPANNLTQLVAVASLFTSIITGLGLIISNAIAWKKELRERGNFELDAEKKRLEIEKLKRELDALKAREGISTVPPSRDND